MDRIGVDIGGTNVKMGLVDENCRVIMRDRFPTPKTSRELLGSVITRCRAIAEQVPVDFVGIGAAGRVDRKTGRVFKAENLPFPDDPVAQQVEKALSIHVEVDNDANCALIGEHAAGACRDVQDVVLLSIGTGIGGALLMNGKICRGSRGTGGEFGHFVFNLHGRKCSCGLRGCFEQYASATALIERTKRQIEKNPGSILAGLAGGGVTGKTVFDAADLGCPEAEKVLRWYGRNLALGIESIMNMLEPAVVVLSGGITRQKEKLLALITPYLREDTIVKTAALGDDAGMIGAAMLEDF